MCCRAGGETEGRKFCVEALRKKERAKFFEKTRENNFSFALHAVVVCCKSNLKEQPNQSNAR
jgi:hypothetical protein